MSEPTLPHESNPELSVSDLKQERLPSRYSYKSPFFLGRLTLGLLLGGLLALLSGAGGLAWVMVLCQNGIHAAGPSDEIWELAWSIHEWSELIGIILLLITYFIFGAWIIRICKNSAFFLHSYKNSSYGITNTLSLTTPGMSIAHYIIPIISLWKPYQDMQMFDKSSHYANTKTTARILPYWWLLYLASAVIGSIYWDLWEDENMTYEDIAEAGTKTQFLLITDILLYILAALIVYRITRGQLLSHSKLEIEKSISQDKESGS